MENNVVKIGKYLNTILYLVGTHNFDSLVKIEMVSFMLNHHNEFKSFSFSKCNQMHNFFQDFLSLLYVNSEELSYINEALYILESENVIKITNDKVAIVNAVKHFEDPFLYKSELMNLLDEVSKVNIKSFLEDVLQYA